MTELLLALLVLRWRHDSRRRAGPGRVDPLANEPAVSRGVLTVFHAAARA